MYPDKAARAQDCRRKLEMSERMARFAACEYRSSGDRRYLSLKAEALGDARYWRAELKKATTETTQ